MDESNVEPLKSFIAFISMLACSGELARILHRFPSQGASRPQTGGISLIKLLTASAIALAFASSASAVTFTWNQGGNFDNGLSEIFAPTTASSVEFASSGTFFITLPMRIRTVRT